MTFNSLTFAVFFLAVLALHNAPLSWRVKKINLLIASYLFYTAWSPPFILLLWLSTAVDWQAARWIDQAKTQAGRRAFLILSLAVNLGVLGYFKYGEFLLENFAEAVRALGVAYQPPKADIILPVGISFYTFQTMAYTLDVYLRRARPTKSLLDFSLFVTFFPQLVAGPIVRPTDLVPQFAAPRTATAQQLGWGLALMVIGLFEKVTLADGFLAPAVDAVYEAKGGVPALDAWIGAIAFSGQIFFDFAGYSTIAIGSAMALGFALPDNFRAPYAAIGFSDFWRRWHITLSTWLRDYLYIPLGGNRRGRLRSYLNLMVTMLLGGLWHGASWTFVVWGGLHGAYLAIERWWRDTFTPAPITGAGIKLLAVLATFLVVTVTWVFFRAQSFEAAWVQLESMAGMHAGEAPPLRWSDVIAVLVVIAGMLGVQWSLRERRLEDLVAASPSWALSGALATMAAVVVITQGTGDAFIYFQF